MFERVARSTNRKSAQLAERMHAMVDNYIIETPRGAAGLVVRSGRGFLFFSAKREFDILDGQLFPNPERAAKAAIRQETKRANLFSATPD
jgi:hypothetical protein